MIIYYPLQKRLGGIECGLPIGQSGTLFIYSIDVTSDKLNSIYVKIKCPINMNLCSNQS